jgi:hypothetical protein
MVESVYVDSSFIIGYSEESAVRGEGGLSDFLETSGLTRPVLIDSLTINMKHPKSIVLPFGIANDQLTCRVEHNSIHTSSQIVYFLK